MLSMDLVASSLDRLLSDDSSDAEFVATPTVVGSSCARGADVSLWCPGPASESSNDESSTDETYSRYDAAAERHQLELRLSASDVVGGSKYFIVQIEGEGERRSDGSNLWNDLVLKCELLSHSEGRRVDIFLVFVSAHETDETRRVLVGYAKLVPCDVTCKRPHKMKLVRLVQSRVSSKECKRKFPSHAFLYLSDGTALHPSLGAAICNAVDLCQRSHSAAPGRSHSDSTVQQDKKTSALAAVAPRSAPSSALMNEVADMKQLLGDLLEEVVSANSELDASRRRLAGQWRALERRVSSMQHL